MQIFIANNTLQRRELHLRIPGSQNTRMLPIAPGQQERLEGDFSGDSLKKVLDQIQRAGGIPANEITLITRPRALIYRVEAKPIPVGVIEAGMEKDVAARQEVAAEQMERAGMSVFAIANRHSPGKVRETSVVIEQVADGLSDRIEKVSGGVDYEVTVSAKPGVAGKKQTASRQRRRG